MDQGTNWEMIIGISSSIIALCALILSIWQGIETRKHNRLSFKPHLTTWTHKDAQNGCYAVELINNGLGPAIIESFTVSIDGIPVSGPANEQIDKALKVIFPNIGFHANHSYVAQGYAMAAKERCTLVTVRFVGPTIPSKEFIEHAGERVKIDIAYNSLYGEPFKISTSDESTK